MTTIIDGILHCGSCPRCGKEHSGLPVAEVGGEKIMAKCLFCPAIHNYSHYAACPETGSPILLFMAKEVGCRATSAANRKAEADEKRPENPGGG